jgi:hypothetical protein
MAHLSELVRRSIRRAIAENLAVVETRASLNSACDPGAPGSPTIARSSALGCSAREPVACVRVAGRDRSDGSNGSDGSEIGPNTCIGWVDGSGLLFRYAKGRRRSLGPCRG